MGQKNSTDLQILLFVSEIYQYFDPLTYSMYIIQYQAWPSSHNHWVHYYCLDGTFPADDDNRIALKPLPDVSDCQRDYINACYVDVREFIVDFLFATQTIIPTIIIILLFIFCVPKLTGLLYSKQVHGHPRQAGMDNIM